MTLPRHCSDLSSVTFDTPILIYGTGKRGVEAFHKLSAAHQEITGFVDTFSSGEILGKPIFDVNQLQLDPFNTASYTIILASMYWLEMLAALDTNHNVVVLISDEYERLPFTVLEYVGFTNGTFVEAGANNGLVSSNTFILERYYNWRGLLVEPVPTLFQACKTNRPKAKVEHAALVASSYNYETIQIRDSGLTSRIIESDDTVSSTDVLTVPAKKLDALLNAHAIDNIDLLSLDVEDYETEALAGLNLKKNQPTYLLIETRKLDVITSYLNAYYEMVVALSPRDFLFKIRS